jgi:frataxin-like iron-binding protein CyaY
MITLWLTKGRPRQFIEIWLNSRWSTLFHFEVPDAKWHTVTSRPVSAMTLASSVFQARSR